LTEFTDLSSIANPWTISGGIRRRTVLGERYRLEEPLGHGRPHVHCGNPAPEATVALAALAIELNRPGSNGDLGIPRACLERSPPPSGTLMIEYVTSIVKPEKRPTAGLCSSRNFATARGVQ
jgi:hypothetical protein